jgi:pentatricopeptide repeat protein
MDSAAFMHLSVGEGGGVGKAALFQKSIYVFLEMKHRGLVPNSYIHVSVSDLYIPGFLGKIAHRYMHVKIGR